MLLGMVVRARMPNDLSSTVRVAWQMLRLVQLVVAGLAFVVEKAFYAP